MADMLVHLKRGYILLQRANSQGVDAAMAYGAWLEKTVVLFTADRRTQSSDKTWREFLENEVGIDDSYARKLRETYKDFTRLFIADRLRTLSSAALVSVRAAV